MSARPSLLALALALVAFAIGCVTTSAPPSSSTESTPPPPTPPTFEGIEIPSWPPLAANDRVSIRLSDDEQLARLTATFKNVARRTLSGTTSQVDLTGSELGEGIGTLALVACDRRNSCRERVVSNLLVDMTAPEAELERATVSPKLDGIDGQVAVWVSDAWVLGGVTMNFNGKVLEHEFPEAYPATLGKEWDVSRVAFSAKDLSEGEGNLIVNVRDAAGNARVQTFQLRVDGTAPTVTIAEPANGTSVSGTFDVEVTASDDGPTPPIVEIWVGGARILEAKSPIGSIAIDASTLSPGVTEVRAIARDEAGNRSTPAQISVNVLHAR